MILVTGGTGLIGTHLLLWLIRRGENVRALYRTQGKKETCRKIFQSLDDQGGSLFDAIEWIQGDITDIMSLEKAFVDVDYVYHSAAYISFETRNYLKLRKANIEGTANIVNQCIAHSVKKLCYVSSVSTLGEPINNQPIDENSEWDSEKKHSVYAITKYGAEMEAWRCHHEGIPTVIVNPGIVIGPGYFKGSGYLFSRLYQGLSYYTEGGSGYIGIDDVVRAMLQLMNSEIAGERFILVAENVVYQDILTRVAGALNVPPPSKKLSETQLKILSTLEWFRSLLPGRKHLLNTTVMESLITYTKYSSAKIENQLHFQFTPIDQAIQETATYFLQYYPGLKPE